MAPSQLSKYTLLFFSCTFLLNFLTILVSSLNIGVETTGITVSVSKECSTTCESSFCSVPPLLRYGKYCGLLYSGCPGERPCDGLDACCMYHDKCVQAKNNDYLSQECSETFMNCMEKFKKSRAATFQGNQCDVDDVIEVINVVMEAALLAGRVLHKP
ncbi:unnamed protein product [Sphenostylis stenocarpa]|uniref:phospholipase A2 n=1 Tax=Sphenostylis stenocarpa TaxID=92480 RepID=A0AA86VX63_9FABA|nr:unnamed protein product [Sphenostylis stenocarpa]